MAKDAGGHGSFAKGDAARFEGEAADKSIIGGANVTIVNPHSNAHEVAYSKGRREYTKEGYQHIPTATVSRQRPGGRGEHVFEAYHHTLRKL